MQNNNAEQDHYLNYEGTGYLIKKIKDLLKEEITSSTQPLISDIQTLQQTVISSISGLEREVKALKEEVDFINDKLIFDIRKTADAHSCVGFLAKADTVMSRNWSQTSQRTYDYTFTPEDDNSWRSLPYAGNITVKAGEVVYIKGSGSNTSDPSGYVRINGSSNGNVVPIGKLEYLVDSIGSSYCAYGLFQENESIKDASNLIIPATTPGDHGYVFMFYRSGLIVPPALPATTMSAYCYNSMFNDCIYLETSPTLPATTLAQYCYAGMFTGCVKLNVAPELPATNLEDNCYTSMFYGCTNLQTAPVLSAQTLAAYCYQSMFNGCTSLNYIKCYAKDISASGCTLGWVTNVAQDGDFIALPGVEWSRGEDGVPEAWNLDQTIYNSFRISGQAGETTKIRLVSTGSSSTGTVYLDYSFDNGETWNYWSDNSSYLTIPSDAVLNSVWLRGNNSNGFRLGYSGQDNAYFDINSTGTTSVFGKITSLINENDFDTRNNIPSNGLSYLFRNNTSLVDASGLILPTSLTDNCFFGMFQGCTNLTEVPELLATEYGQGSYGSMFNGCSSLDNIKCLLLSPSSGWCCFSWVYGVAANGIFTKHPDAEWTTGANGIPEGWEVVDWVPEGAES